MARDPKSVIIELNRDLKLNGDHYDVWSVKIKFPLDVHGLLDTLSSVVPEPEEGTIIQRFLEHRDYLTWKNKNSSARMILLSAMDDDITMQFHKYENAMDLWIALKEKFGTMSSIKLRCLAIKFDSYQKKPEHSMRKHITVMENMITKLDEAGHKLSEELKVEGVIRSLPESWKRVKNQLLYMRSIQTFQDVAHYLEGHEESRLIC